MKLDIVVARELDRTELQDARARRRHLEHLLVADRVQLPRVRDDARICGVHAVDVRVDLARFGAERGRERHRGRVRAPAAERGDVEVGGDTLEARHENYPLRVESLVDATGADVDDLRLAVGGVRDDAGLRAGERDRLVAEVVDGHRAERAGDALADRDQHVELARLRLRRDLVREPNEVVRRVAHR